MAVAAVGVAIAMAAAACGSSSGTDSTEAATTTAAVSDATAAAGTGVFMVRVQYQVDEATADEVLSVLAANDFDEFAKEASTAGGFDVVAHGLTEDGAAALVVRLTTDTDVPYPGVVFEES
jgi:hypothetical protein